MCPAVLWVTWSRHWELVSGISNSEVSRICEDLYETSVPSSTHRRLQAVSRICEDLDETALSATSTPLIRWGRLAHLRGSLRDCAIR